MFDCQFYDVKPGGHHLTNVLLHAAEAVVLFLALRRMTRATWPSAWVAAVFAIHPLRVESVAWVAERKDVLSGLFFMSTLWFYARYAERPASWGRYVLVVASFALGLMAKPMLVTLPFVLLLLDYWPLGRVGGERGAGSGERGAGSGDSSRNAAEGVAYRGRRGDSLVRLVVEKIPLFVLAAASCAVTLVAQRGAMTERVDFSGRVANAATAYVAYLGKMVYPAALAVFYPFPMGPRPAWEAVAAIALLLAISTAVFVARRKCPYLLFGWLWYLGTLVPVIGLVQVGAQSMADRYTYLTQIGLYMALAWGAAEVAAAWPHRRWPLAAASAPVLAALIVCAWQQTQLWSDSASLWEHTVSCTSPNPSALSGLGNALAAHGRDAEAIAQYTKALDITLDYAEPHYNLATVLARSGQPKEAIAHFLKALEIKPNYAAAHYNLGVVLANSGRPDEAIAHYRSALAIKPDHVETHYNLGVILAGRGELDEAISHYRMALEVDPDHAAAHHNLAEALVRRGKVDEAIVHYRKALEINPDLLEAHYNLGVVLAGLGKADEAMAHFQKALDLATARNDGALADTIRAQIKKNR
jgi:tetratricopeptide (TPR) repeat protein